METQHFPVIEYTFAQKVLCFTLQQLRKAYVTELIRFVQILVLGESLDFPHQHSGSKRVLGGFCVASPAVCSRWWWWKSQQKTK